MREQPIIWKKTDCLKGQCVDGRTKHWESIPFSTPMGLITECFHCHKIRQVKIG